jgi:hypothetical protein
MKRKQINRIIQMPITIHAEADIQKAVTQIHLAAGKASKGGRVEITIVEPGASQKPKGPKQEDKQQPEAPGARVDDPGSQNKAPDKVPAKAEAPEIPELVQKAQAKIAQAKIPTAKERKALAEWEAAQQ